MKKLSSALLLFLFFVSGYAQQEKQIVIETKNTLLVLNVAPNKRVTQSYLGKKIPALEYQQLQGGREVYLTAGMENQFEPAIRMVHADGNPSLELQYVSHNTSKNGNVTTTAIALKDPVYPVQVILYYTSYYNEDIIKSRTEIKHSEKK